MGEQGWHCKEVQNGLREQRKETDIDFYCGYGVQPIVRFPPVGRGLYGLNLSPVPEGELGLP